MVADDDTSIDDSENEKAALQQEAIFMMDIQVIDKEDARNLTCPIDALFYACSIENYQL